MTNEAVSACGSYSSGIEAVSVADAALGDIRSIEGAQKGCVCRMGWSQENQRDSEGMETIGSVNGFDDGSAWRLRPMMEAKFRFVPPQRNRTSLKHSDGFSKKVAGADEAISCSGKEARHNQGQKDRQTTPKSKKAPSMKSLLNYHATGQAAVVAAGKAGTISRSVAACADGMSPKGERGSMMSWRRRPHTGEDHA